MQGVIGKCLLFFGSGVAKYNFMVLPVPQIQASFPHFLPLGEWGHNSGERFFAVAWAQLVAMKGRR